MAKVLKFTGKPQPPTVPEAPKINLMKVLNEALQGFDLDSIKKELDT